MVNNKYTTLTTPLYCYNENNVRHTLSSYVNIYSKQVTLNLTHGNAVTRTSRKWPAFIYWYIKFSRLLHNRKYFLSSSQKKYQTVSINTFVLEQKTADIVELYDLLTFLHSEVFPDQIKQVYEGSISVQKNCITFYIPELPFNIYNQNPAFQQLFALGTQGIGLTVKGTFQLNCAPFTLFLFLFYKYLLYPTD